MRRLIAGLLLVLVIATVGNVHCSSDNLYEAYRILREYGLSDVAASAIVGNIKVESGGSPSCVEGGRNGRGIGLFQVSMNSNRQALEDFCRGIEHTEHEKVVLRPNKAPKSYIVCNNVRCQIDAVLGEIAATMNIRHWAENYDMQVSELSLLQNAILAGMLPPSLGVVSSWDAFCRLEDLQSAVFQFMCDYETPSSSRCFWVGIDSYSDSEEAQQAFISSYTERYQAALEVYNAYSIWGADIGVKSSIYLLSTLEFMEEPVDNQELAVNSFDFGLIVDILLVLMFASLAVLWGRWTFRYYYCAVTHKVDATYAMSCKLIAYLWVFAVSCLGCLALCFGR